MDNISNSDPFGQAMWESAPQPLHRIGGYSQPIHTAVEIEAAMVALGGDDTEAVMREEARRWTLLAQIDSDDDADMMWGDSGCLYWLIRREDLAARRFDAAMFTWHG